MGVCGSGSTITIVYVPHCLLTTASVNFTVMSYNVLCDKYATRQMYGYCPSWALAWDYRKAALLKEIMDSSADIIALQVRQCTNVYGSR